MGRFEYAFVQARKNIVRNGLMTVASLFTITGCLVILGLFVMMSLNVNYITSKIKDQCEIQVFLDADASDSKVKEVGKQLKALDNVKEAVLFTKEDMLSYAENDIFEENSELTLGFDEDDNPFSDSYKVTLIDIALTSDTVKQIEGFSSVEYIDNKQEVVDNVVHISDYVKKFSIAAVVLLMVIALVIISNTVRLTVFNRRKEINIMKYIGATDRFIRVPFIIEGVTIGIIGAGIAFALVSWGYAAVSGAIAKTGYEMFMLLDYGSVWLIVAVLFAVVGGNIGMFGSMISMRRYLKV